MTSHSQVLPIRIGSAFGCFLLPILLTHSGHAVEVCEIRAESKEVGAFDASFLDEASGLALASDGKHFFVANDSGDKPRFFRTLLDGSKIESIDITGWKPFDPEDLAVGPCPGGKEKDLNSACLAMADIGDNRSRRKSIEIGFIRLGEIEKSPLAIKERRVSLEKVIKLAYPDRAHNAEAFGLIDRDWGLIVTKEQNRKSRAAEMAHVFFVDLKAAKVRSGFSWNVPEWTKDQGLGGLVTALSLHHDSKGRVDRLLLLTYTVAIELELDVEKFMAPMGATKVEVPIGGFADPIVKKRILKLDSLDQQEAITYDETGGGFYYTTEAPMILLGQKRAPIRHAKIPDCNRVGGK